MANTYVTASDGYCLAEPVQYCGNKNNDSIIVNKILLNLIEISSILNANIEYIEYISELYLLNCI